jgi:hypothetical protein
MLALKVVFQDPASLIRRPECLNFNDGSHSSRYGLSIYYMPVSQKLREVKQQLVILLFLCNSCSYCCSYCFNNNRNYYKNSNNNDNVNDSRNNNNNGNENKDQ